MDLNSPEKPGALSGLGTAIGRTRFIVLLAVIAVLLVAISLFLMGAVLAFTSIWKAWGGMVAGNAESSRLTVSFLEIVNVMLEAVVFYLVGVGLYSLFIGPLNVAIALGVETLNDLEDKIISVVVAILAVHFLEHFIQWKEPMETLQFGVALSVVVFSLVLFQIYSHRSKEDQKAHNPDVQARAQQKMFVQGDEAHEVRPDEVAGTANPKKED